MATMLRLLAFLLPLCAGALFNVGEGDASALIQHRPQHIKPGDFDPRRPDPVDFNCQRLEWIPPTLCPQGNSHWSLDELQQAVPAFSALYATRPVQRNHGGMNVNHAFALWFTAKQLKPKYIIESGVFKGQSTWLLRQAVPEARIFSLDPENRTNLAYTDDTPLTTYLLEEKFLDLPDVDWAAQGIPESERDQTLVVLDDHQHAVRRVKQLMELGFEHLWFDDNCRACEDRCRFCDMYSFNMMCSPVPGPHNRTVIEKDDFGRILNRIPIAQHQANWKFVSDHMAVYFEFPPIFEGCPEGTLRHSNTSLLTDKEALKLHGLPTIREDPYYYGTRHPPYVRLQKSKTTSGTEE